MSTAPVAIASVGSPGPLGSLTQQTVASVSQVITGATSGTVRLTQSELILNPASAIAVSGSVAGVRGAVTLQSGKSASSGSYIYGTQGKFTGDGATLDVGSAHVAGLYGQLSLVGSTLTSGHIAAVIADIGPNSPASALYDGIYVERGSASGGPSDVMNSVLKAIADAAVVFDISEFHANNVMLSTTGTAGTTAAKGWLKVNVAGATRYIPLADSVS